MPSLRGSDDFKGQIYHHKHLGQTDLINDPNVKDVTVIGGGKSAADVVYAFAKANKNVSWVIRTTGTGGPLLTPAEGVGPYLNAPEIGMTRIAGILSPSPFSPYTWTQCFLHSTRLGESLVRSFFALSESACTRLADYHSRKNALPGFSSLAPTSVSLRWLVGNIGVITHPDFWDVVAQSVHIHRGDMTRLQGHTAILSNGEELRSDLVVDCTGYKSTLPFLSPGLKAHLGLPCPSSAMPPTLLAHWTDLEKAEDKRILSRFPFLSNAPSDPSSTIKSDSEAESSQPYRLYRGILSPYAPLVLIGHLLHGNHFMAAEVQAIWAVAALSGRLEIPDKKDMEGDIASFVAWAWRRYPAHSETANSVVLEGMGYLDSLLGEMDLSCCSKGWWRDGVLPVLPKDLDGLVGQWRERCRVRGVSVESDL